MKKGILAVCILLALLCSTAAAAGVSYENWIEIQTAGLNPYALDELDMALGIPDGYHVFTREDIDGELSSSLLGMTREDLLSFMAESSIYLDAIKGDLSHELVVTMLDVQEPDLNQLGAADLESLKATMRSQLESIGFTFLGSDLYEQEQTKFMAFHWRRDDGSTHGLQYYTVHNSKGINITLRSYTGPISAEQESMIQTVMDSVIFAAAPQSAPAVTTPAFLYTDGTTGVSFTVPANWKQTDNPDDNEYVYATFSPLEDPACVIQYSYMDLWESMSPADRLTTPRSQIDGSYFTEEEMKSIFGSYGIPMEGFRTVTYGGRKFFGAQFNYTDDSLGTAFTVSVTQFLYIENGTMHMFQFLGTQNDPLYADFEALLNSVEVPGSGEDASDRVSPEVPASGEDASDRVSPEVPSAAPNRAASLLTGILLFLAVMAAVGLPCILLARRAVRKNGAWLHHQRLNTPLKFHSFFRYFSAPLGCLSLCGSIVNTLYRTQEFNWGTAYDLVYSITAALLLLICFIGFFSWSSIAWHAVILCLSANVAYSLSCLILFIALLPDQVPTMLGQLIGQLIYSIPAGIYYYKRAPLFCPDLVSGIAAPDTPPPQPAERCCPLCGKPLPPESVFCSHCGQKLP